jgi:hypothetical protein
MSILPKTVFFLILISDLKGHLRKKRKDKHNFSIFSGEFCLKYSFRSLRQGYIDLFQEEEHFTLGPFCTLLTHKKEIRNTKAESKEK